MNKNIMAINCNCFFVCVGFSIEGPCQAKIDCKDNGDGSADITYWPTMPGEYAVHILCNEQDIPKSPWMAEIKPATKEFDPTRVRSPDLPAVPHHCFTCSGTRVFKPGFQKCLSRPAIKKSMPVQI